MSDIKNLLLNTEIDLSYVRSWIKKLQLKTFGLL